MDNIFHENVSDDYVEYFLLDLEKNLKQLNELLAALSRETSYDSRMSIDTQLTNLVDAINEEIEMYTQLYDFRLLTSAEQEVVKRIRELRDTEYIEAYRKATR